MQLNVLLVGEDAAGIQTLRALMQSSQRIAAVMASPEKPSFGGSSLWDVAQNLGYSTWPAQWVKDPSFADKIRQAGVDILLNVHSLYIIHSDLLEAPRLGCYNLHPGPLPRYAGLNPVSWAIYHGEKTHGVTVHRMAPEIDAGPLAFQACFEIGEQEPALQVSARCVEPGIQLLLKLLETASHQQEEIPLTPQDRSQREYFGKGPPQRGWIDWTRPARQVYNFIRACDYYPFPSPWGHPRTELGGQELSIIKAILGQQPATAAPGAIGEVGAAGVQVACGDDWLLVKKVKKAHQIVDASMVFLTGERLKSRYIDPIHPT